MNVLLSVLLGMVLLAGPAAAGGVLRDSGAGAAAVPVAGQPAPDFRLPGLDGTSVALSQLRGRVVLINFWASWCPPCVEEIPSLDQLARSYPGEEFLVLAVNVEDKTAADLRRFLDGRPHGFTVVQDRAKVAQNLYGVRRLPESFLVDRNGKVVRQYIGGRDWMAADVRGAIDFLRGK